LRNPQPVDCAGVWPGRVFLVLRGQTFAGNALAHVGFTGATGAVLIGISPLWGLVALTVAGGIGMGLLAERLHERDVAIGIVLALSLAVRAWGMISRHSDGIQ
jgi:ABC-type Mn2+/Zn2+ transport system permease subunit